MNRVGGAGCGGVCGLLYKEYKKKTENGKVPFVVDRWQLPN
jgi:hypothetical protein